MSKTQDALPRGKDRQCQDCRLIIVFVADNKIASMYLDFSLEKEMEFEADVCIIGAGAAGFSCALSFLSSNLKVLVLEGGLEKFDQQAADLHKGEVAGLPHLGIHEARERIVGGTTTTWGGQAYPFMKQDFEKRDHVENSGWPITLEDLEPYYLKAEKVLGTDSSVPYFFRPWKSWKVTEPTFDASRMDLFVTKWCKVPNFVQQHGSKIENSRHVHILRNANVAEIIPTTTLDAVKEVHIRSLSGKAGKVKAKYFIAAGGAMETVRLFLSSTKFGDKGIGNDAALVGRYFQDHIGAIVGRIIPVSKKYFHNVFNPFYKRGFKYFPRIRMNPVFAQEAKLLHASAQVVFTEEENGILKNSKAFLKSFKRGRISWQEVKALLKPGEIVQLGAAVSRWKFTRRGSASKTGPIWLEVHCEQEPKHDSFVELGDNTDQLGTKRIRLHWKISDLTVTTMRKLARVIAEEFERSGIAHVVLEPWVRNEKMDPRILLHDTFHQAGGLRMAENNREGVVDSSCRVFGVENLYVASSAVFPTSSFSNPTMTTMALSIRIAEHIEKLLGT